MKKKKKKRNEKEEEVGHFRVQKSLISARARAKMLQNMVLLKSKSCCKIMLS